MYKLFSERQTISTGEIHPPEFEVIRKNLRNEILKIMNYYHSRVFIIVGTHVLSRLITNAYTDPTLSDEDYVTRLILKSPYLGNALNFTSELKRGKFFDGVFYGPGNPELILNVTSYFDPVEARANWKTLQPVKVLEHPVTNTGFRIPTGEDKNYERGLSVISVDIPLLMFQYRCFEQRHFTAKLGTGSEAMNLGAQHFIKMFVIPNMLYSHAELVIMNRLQNLFYGYPMGFTKVSFVQPIRDYDRQLDKVLGKILKGLENRNKAYGDMMLSFPAFFHEDQQEALLMPDISRTSQVWWALLLTRLRHMKFLVDLGGERGIQTNGTLLNVIRRDLMRLNNDPSMDNLPDQIKYPTDEYVQFLIGVKS